MTTESRKKTKENIRETQKGLNSTQATVNGEERELFHKEEIEQACHEATKKF